MASAVSKGVNLGLSLLKAQVDIYSAIETKTGNVTVCCGTDEDPHDPRKIYQQRRCNTCGDVAATALHKAREVAGGLVVLTAEDQEVVSADAAQFKKDVELHVHPAEQVDVATAPGDKQYHLVPTAGSSDIYNVLAELITRHPELRFTCRFTPRSAVSVFVASTVTGQSGRVILLQERVAGDALRAAPAVAPPAANHEQLLALAESLLPTQGENAIVRPFDVDTYRDTGRIALDELIAARTPVTVMDGVGTPVTATSALAMLEAAVAAANPTPVQPVAPVVVTKAARKPRKAAVKKVVAKPALKEAS